MLPLRAMRALLSLAAASLLLGTCRSSLVDFHRLDVLSPSFDVDGGLSEADRWVRLSSAASVPLKGWNSYDGWDWSVAEADVVRNMDYMAAHLLQYGYNIATVDYYWYMALDGRTTYMDEYGRVQPDPARFPSSTQAQGFKKLAAYAHSKGLLFGIHTMRGINVVAITNKTAVLNSSYTADEVYDRNSPCEWTGGGLDSVSRFYSLNMSHPGGQLFYDSLYAQYAEWGVDFIKNDCVYAEAVLDQVDAVATAIDHSGRRMLFSLSPGRDTLDTAARIVNETNMYRVTGDTWDRWDNIYSHFISAQRLQPYIAYPNGRYGLPSWPDLDMLPLGWIGIEGSNISPVRLCSLTQDEQVTLMSLWTIFRSPLMYGGDLQHPDAFSLSLLTNEEALAISDNSTNTDYVLSGPTLAVWRSDDAGWQQSGVSYFTVHNIGDAPMAGLTLRAAQLRGKQAGSECTLRDVWARKDVSSGGAFSFDLRPHQSGLYALHSCQGGQVAEAQTQTKAQEAQRARGAVATA